MWRFSQAMEFFCIQAKVVNAPQLQPVVFFVLMTTMTTLMLPATSFGMKNIAVTSGVTSIRRNEVGYEKSQGHYTTDASLFWLNTDVVTDKKEEEEADEKKKAAIAAATTEQQPTYSSSDEFRWGHVTKYSSILYDEDVVVKGPIIFDVKYPEIENSNSHTIIGIHAYNNNAADDDDDDGVGDLNNENKTGNQDLKVYPVMGGIGFNFTVVRFLLASEHELHYKLTIRGVDI
ncbi:uncharacterized protein [Musca autumnalis]|uniref:uncharacterized protein n=1 Tax=Musca autumnalis TaxID=221902 RepID=UPI003CF8DEEB